MRQTFTVVLPCVISFTTVACATRSPSGPAPTPTPSTATPPAAPPRPTEEHHTLHTGPWTFAYTPGTYTYTTTTTGRVASVPDTARQRIFPATSRQIAIRVTSESDIQMIVPSPSTPTPTSGCDTTAALAVRVQQFTPKVPGQLATGLTWRDSTTTAGCWEMIPITVTRRSTYTVLRDTMYSGSPALHVEEKDSMTATGEGSNGQHRVLVSATGTGTRNLYLDTAAGRLLGLVGTQTAELSVTTSGRTRYFRQEITERAALATPLVTP